MSRVDRAALPSVGPPPAFSFPVVHKGHLTNQLSVWSAEQHALPLVTLTLLLPAGSSSDFEGHEGLAALTADLVDEGTGNLSAIDVNGAFAALGTQLETEVSPDATLFTVTVLSRFVRQATQLFAECILRPRFDHADVERVRQLRLMRLLQIRDMPAAIADRAFMQVLYGTHPYAHMSLGTEESLKQLTAESVHAFHARMYQPSRATFIAAGDVSPDDIQHVAADAFGHWPASGTPLEDASSAPPPPAPVHRLVLVNKPGSAQSEIRIGEVGLARNTPDFYALVVLNMVLGGQFVSRINMKLRQEKGLTYGARTSFDFRRGRGPFMLQTSVQSDGTAEAVAASLDEIRALRDGRPPSSEEVDIARAALTRGYPRNFETAEQLARAMAQLAIYDLPGDYYDRFADRVNAITVEDTRRAAALHLDPERMATAIVGDAEVVEAQLERAGLGVPAPLLPRL